MWPFTRSMAARTRPQTLSASRRQRRPELECLEEKKVLSTVFGSYPSGTWAFNDQTGWRPIDPSIPTAMKEGMDGTLFVSYSSGPHQGTDRYDFDTDSWTQLSSWVASTLSASQSDNTLFTSFSGSGVWEFNGIWHQLASHEATLLAAVSNNDVYASLTGTRTGTWHYNNGWTQIASRTPIAMDASPDGTLYASFSDGTYEDNGGWTKTTDYIATSIAAISSTDMYASFTYGVAEWDPGSFGWPGMYFSTTSDVASHLGHSGSKLIGSFGNGTRTFDATNVTNSWVQIDSDHAYMFG